MEAVMLIRNVMAVQFLVCLLDVFATIASLVRLSDAIFAEHVAHQSVQLCGYASTLSADIS